MLSIVPQLPPELYRGVISTLDVGKSDARNALLSLAVASKHLCHESQRVLFERNDAIMYFARDDKDAITRHHQFVQAIFNHPARFGPFVRRFVQVDIAHTRKVYQPQSFRRETKKRERLWELTVKTLPYLINLKVLAMTRDFVPGTTMLRSCDFQLDVLQYQASRTSDLLLSVVLPTQRGLLHLSLYSHVHQDTVLLTEHNCIPSLISIECDIQLFGRIARTRKIIAYAVRGVTPYQIGRLPVDDNDRRLCKDALGRLECFKMDANLSPEWREQLNVILDGSHLRITLLELDDCLFDSHREDLFRIAPLPELRVLSLRFPRAIWPDRFARFSGATKAFLLYPKLQQVFFWDEKNGIKWVYSRSGGTTVDDESEDAQDVRSEILNSETPDVRGALCWEDNLPAESMWGTMWWKCFDP